MNVIGFSIAPQHPGSEVHENTGGAAPPAVEKAGCKLGNVEIELDEIQGNIFGDFNRDHQVFVFFRIDDAKKAKKTLGPVDEKADDFPSGILNHVRHSASDAVPGFNEQFRALRRAGLPEGSIKATWTNLVLRVTGMTKLGQSIEDLTAAFTQGMGERAPLLGDVEGNKPADWNNDMDVEVDWLAVDGMINTPTVAGLLNNS